MLDDALDEGLIAPGTTVIESSSGNMGVGLAQACRYHGLRLICVVDAAPTTRTCATMRALGADVRVVTGPIRETGDLLAARLELVRELLATTPGAFWPNQYANASNPAAHADGTMREIDEALDGDLDYLFVATSTTGTLRGCCDYLREHGPRHARRRRRRGRQRAVRRARARPRRCPGFGAGVETELSRRREFDRLVRVSDLDCVVGCRRLVAARGDLRRRRPRAAVAAALRAARAGAARRAAAARSILPDGGAGYLDTVYDDEWVAGELGCSADELAALTAPTAPDPTPTRRGLTHAGGGG